MGLKKTFHAIPVDEELFVKISGSFMLNGLRLGEKKLLNVLALLDNSGKIGYICINTSPIMIS